MNTLRSIYIGIIIIMIYDCMTAPQPPFVYIFVSAYSLNRNLYSRRDGISWRFPGSLAGVGQGKRKRNQKNARSREEQQNNQNRAREIEKEK